MKWTPDPLNGPVVCGHRGAPVAQSENTLVSFQAALDRGATWVEFDVRPTCDGQLIIHHDPDTASGQHIASHKYGDLDNKNIPAFSQLATTLPTLGLDIEMKTDGIDISLEQFADLVVEEVESHVSTGQVVVTSFDARAVALVHERSPNLATGLLFWDQPTEWAIETAIEAGHGAIAPWIDLLTMDVVEQARAAGLWVATWTVNDPKQVIHARNLGVDMIIGDDPAVIIDHL